MQHLKPQIPTGARFASDAEIHRLSELVSRFRRITVLTGAGISTESGLADYRSPGRKRSRPPIRHQDFVASSQVRQYYWARSFVGFPVLRNARPGLAHHALAALHDRLGSKYNHHITQNVDGLLQAARLPTFNLLELHGTIHRVRCRSCESRESRQAFQHRLQNLNLSWAQELQNVYEYRPDGDAEIDRQLVNQFQVPRCSACEQDMLIPDLVFHGGQVPLQVTQSAIDRVSNSQVLLIIGSSVTPFSAYRLVKSAKENGAFLACINFGPTRADPLIDFKIEALVGNAMARFANLEIDGGFLPPESLENELRKSDDPLERRLEL